MIPATSKLSLFLLLVAAALPFLIIAGSMLAKGFQGGGVAAPLAVADFVLYMAFFVGFTIFLALRLRK